MPYNPGVTDISGQLLAQSINGAVNGVAQNQKAIYASKDELEKELAHLNGVAAFAREKGILKPEDMDAYISGNITKKRELAVKAGMGYEDMLKQQQMQMQQQQLAQGQQRIDLQARGVAIDESFADPELRAKIANARRLEKALNFDINDPSNAGPAAMAGKVWVDGPNGPVLVDKPEPPQKPVTKEDILDSGTGVFGYPINKAKGIYAWMKGVAGVDIPQEEIARRRAEAESKGLVTIPEIPGFDVRTPVVSPEKKAWDASGQPTLQEIETRIQQIKSNPASLKNPGDLFKDESQAGTLSRLQNAKRYLETVQTPAPLPKGTSSANRTAINNALPLPESDGLPPLPPQISNAAEYNALPSKAPYIDPKGIYRIKP